MVPLAGLAGNVPASAADLALKAPPPPVAAPSWVGWYIGVNAGAASQRGYYDDPDDFAYTVGWRSSNAVFIGGGQIGYNWQQGNIVYGLEGDISGLSKSSGTYFSAVGIPSVTYGSSVTWLSTVRGRLGMTVGDGTTLLYGTAGVAVGHISAHSEGGIFGWPLNTYSTTRVGWTGGGGIEHMITPHWTIGLEALYTDLGAYTKASNVDGKCCATVHNTLWSGRFKLNYKF